MAWEVPLEEGAHPERTQKEVRWFGSRALLWPSTPRNRKRELAQVVQCWLSGEARGRVEPARLSAPPSNSRPEPVYSPTHTRLRECSWARDFESSVYHYRFLQAGSTPHVAPSEPGGLV